MARTSVLFVSRKNKTLMPGGFTPPAQMKKTGSPSSLSSMGNAMPPRRIAQVPGELNEVTRALIRAIDQYLEDE